MRGLREDKGHGLDHRRERASESPRRQNLYLFREKANFSLLPVKGSSVILLVSSPPAGKCWEFKEKCFTLGRMRRWRRKG